MDEKQIQHYTDVLCAMLETMDFSLDKQEDGNYCLVDEQGAYFGGMESYEDFEEGSAGAIVDRLCTYLNDHYFEDLEEIAEDEFDVDFSHIDVPADAEDWVKFMDEHEDFRETCFHEYEVMKLISSPEILDSINLDDVVQRFNPKEIVIAQPIDEQEITAESILDIEGDVQISDDYDKLDVYVVMDDQTLDTLMKRADMYEKSGYKDFDEILKSSAIVNTYFVADEKGVDIVLTLDDGEKYHDVTFSEHPDENEFPLSHDEGEMVREKLEHFLGKSVAEYLKAEKEESLESEYAKTDESRSPAKPQWQNFGSPDYLNEGGVQLKMIPHLDEKFDIEAIVLSPNPEDSNSMYAGYVPLDHLDIVSCRNNQEFMEFHGLDENSTIEEIAVALAEENSKQGLGFPLEGNSYEPVDKIALGHKLQGEIGIDVSESLERLEAERAGLDLE